MSELVMIALIAALAPTIAVIGTWANARIAAKAAARLVEEQAATVAAERAAEAVERATEAADARSRLTNIEEKVDGQHTALVAQLDKADSKVEGLVQQLVRADKLQVKTEAQLDAAIVVPPVNPDS